VSFARGIDEYWRRFALEQMVAVSPDSYFPSELRPTCDALVEDGLAEKQDLGFVVTQKGRDYLATDS
jgi:hypothetical protein